MGKVLILQGVDFSNAGLGKVRMSNDKPLVGLSIVGSDVVNGSFEYRVSYSPIDTSYRGVAWSVESGNEYATINQYTGEVTALEGAELSEVVIRATSLSNALIYAEKTIHVSERGVVTGVEYVGASAAEDDYPPYLNTGIKPNSELNYEITFALGGEIDSNKNIYVFGSSNTSSDSGFSVFGQNTNYLASAISYSSGNINVVNRQRSAPSSAGIRAEIGKKYRIVFLSTGVIKVFVDDSETAAYTGSTGTVANSNFNMLIGAIAQKSGTTSSTIVAVRSAYKCKLLIYGFRSYNANDENVCNLQPYLNDGVPCLRDSVSGNIRYYNGASGFLYYKLPGESELEQVIEIE